MTEGFIQSELSPFPIERFFGSKGPGPCVPHFYDVSRSNPEHEKDQDRHPQKRGNHEQ